MLYIISLVNKCKHANTQNWNDKYYETYLLYMSVNIV